jgi:uncharacterized protein YjeT (DUF2065 family)
MSRQALRAREYRRGGLVVGGARASGIAIAIVVAVAGVVWACAPASWRSLIADEQRTDATALAVISIWTNNLLICCLPLLAGTFAHRLVARHRQRWARLVLAIAALGAARSLVTVGVVGGLDPRWLAGAAAWWIPEATALGVCCAAAWRAFREPDPGVASGQLGQALTFACGQLGVAAVVEVALT